MGWFFPHCAKFQASNQKPELRPQRPYFCSGAPKGCQVHLHRMFQIRPFVRVSCGFQQQYHHRCTHPSEQYHRVVAYIQIQPSIRMRRFTTPVIECRSMYEAPILSVMNAFRGGASAWNLHPVERDTFSLQLLNSRDCASFRGCVRPRHLGLRQRLLILPQSLTNH